MFQLELSPNRLQTIQSSKLNKMIFQPTSTFEFIVKVLSYDQNVKIKGLRFNSISL
jgi:hypothetical protein